MWNVYHDTQAGSDLDYLVEKYSDSIDGLDIMKLFSIIEKQTSRSEAARICKIRRKTAYGWAQGKNVRVITKKKVLSALLIWDYEFTIKYLIEKFSKSSTSLLESILGYIYEKIMDDGIESDDINKLHNSFNTIILNYSNYLNIKNSDLLDMYNTINDKASSYGTRKIPLPIALIKSEDMVDVISYVNTIYNNDPSIIPEDLVETYNIPLPLSKKIHELRTEIYVSVPTREGDISINWKKNWGTQKEESGDLVHSITPDVFSEDLMFYVR